MQDAKAKKATPEQNRRRAKETAKGLRVAQSLSESLAADKPKGETKGGILHEIDAQHHRLD